MSAIPPHYLNVLKGQLSSAESIRSAEASLIAKCRRKMRGFGGAWGDVMRLAVLVRDGAVTPGLEQLETIWRDPESRSLGQAADAAVKKAQIGVPQLQLWEDVGYTATQIERMRRMRRQDRIDDLGIQIAGGS